MGQAVIEGAVLTEGFDRSRTDKVRSWLSRYIGKQTFFGFSFNLEALKKDAPNLSSAFGLLNFLHDFFYG